MKTFVSGGPCRTREHFRHSLARCVALIILAGAASSAGSVPLQAVSSTAAPQIRSIAAEADGLVLVVEVPSGVRRVAIENCEDLARNEWRPLASKWVNGQAGEVRFRLPSQGGLGFLRARADAPDLLPLPPLFYEGQTTFAPRWVWEAVPWVAQPVFHPPGMILHADLAVANAFQAQAFNTDSGGEQEPTRDVVESDVWQIDGRTVYYFNSSQGLHVIDLADLDAPQLQGTLKIAGGGEELYLLPRAPSGVDRALALLTYDTCSGTGATVMHVVLVRHGVPRPGSRIVLPGSPRESRLVGNVLYVVTDHWRAFPHLADAVTASDYWRQETIVTSINLARPQAPVVGRPITLAGSADAVHATDTRLFVAMTGVEAPAPAPRARPWLGPGAHAVKIFNISDPSGTVRDAGHVLNAGWVTDKFKMHQSEDVLSVVSLDPAGAGRTILETWSLAETGRPRVLARLPIVSGERLYATRFDGTRLYVVTFRQIDPLWIIDLSDPANPAIAGELQVPGWSTYLHPLGDRVLAMGLEGWRPTVSLFDVALPSAPRLLSKIVLVDGSSEANATEKAFKVLAREGLVLIPVSGSRGTNSVEGIQLVDFHRTTLTLRGLIEHRMNALRAAAVDERLVSISSSELLTVDARDRDQPVVRGRLSLEHTVDRVWVLGPHLLQLTRDATGDGTNSELRVTTQAAPRSALSRMTVEGRPLLGESLRQGRLYLIQDLGPATATLPTNTFATATPARLRLMALDTTRLPELSVLAKTVFETTNYRGGTLTALWPNEHTLVWTSSDPVGFGGLVLHATGTPTPPVFSVEANVATASIATQSGAGVPYFPRFNSTEPRFFAFDLRSPEPRFVSDVTLPPTNGVTYGLSFASGDKAFIGRDTRRALPASPLALGTNAMWVPQIPWVAPFQELHQYEVVVLDYRHPNAPVIRPPVALPGALSALARNGALLFATGPHATDTNDVTRYLHALAYDGFVASLVDSLALSNATTAGALVSETGSVLLGIDSLAGNAPRLVRWDLEPDAQFHRRAAVALPQPAHQLHRFHDLLVVTTGADLELRDAMDTLRFRLLNQEKSDCTWQLNLASADGSKAAGLWLPQGTGGLQHVPAERSLRRQGTRRFAR